MANGPETRSPGSPAGGLGDIFDAFFGGGPFSPRNTGRSGPPKGENVEAMLEVDFAEAVLGTQREVSVRAAATCETCAGTGARRGTMSVTCSTCNGAGRVAPSAPVPARADGDVDSLPPVRRDRRGDPVSLPGLPGPGPAPGGALLHGGRAGRR